MSGPYYSTLYNNYVRLNRIKTSWTGLFSTPVACKILQVGRVICVDVSLGSEQAAKPVEAAKGPLPESVEMELGQFSSLIPPQ